MHPRGGGQGRRAARHARAARGGHRGGRAAGVRDVAGGRHRGRRGDRGAGVKANRAYELIVRRGGRGPALLRSRRRVRPRRGRRDRLRRGRAVLGHDAGPDRPPRARAEGRPRGHGGRGVPRAWRRYELSMSRRAARPRDSRHEPEWSAAPAPITPEIGATAGQRGTGQPKPRRRSPRSSASAPRVRERAGTVVDDVARRRRDHRRPRALGQDGRSSLGSRLHDRCSIRASAMRRRGPRARRPSAPVSHDAPHLGAAAGGAVAARGRSQPPLLAATSCRRCDRDAQPADARARPCDRARRARPAARRAVARPSGRGDPRRRGADRLRRDGLGAAASGRHRPASAPAPASAGRVLEDRARRRRADEDRGRAPARPPGSARDPLRRLVISVDASCAADATGARRRPRRETSCSPTPGGVTIRVRRGDDRRSASARTCESRPSRTGVVRDGSGGGTARSSARRTPRPRVPHDMPPRDREHAPTLRLATPAEQARRRGRTLHGVERRRGRPRVCAGAGYRHGSSALSGRVAGARAGATSGETPTGRGRAQPDVRAPSGRTRVRDSS